MDAWEGGGPQALGEHRVELLAANLRALRRDIEIAR